MSSDQDQSSRDQPGSSQSFGDLPQRQQQQHFQSQPSPHHDNEVRFLFESHNPLPLPDHDDHIDGVDPTYVSPHFVFRPKPGSTPEEAIQQRLKFEESVRDWINYEEHLQRIEQDRLADLENGGPRVRMNFEAPDNMPEPDREP
jgi:hypothetical protein